MTYSFAEEWRALGHLIAACLDVRIKPSGEFVSAVENNIPIVLNASERVLLKRLVTPSRFDLVRQQLDWIRADLDTGPKLLVPQPFDPATGTLRLVTDAQT